MVNYRRVVCEVAFVVALATLATTAPTPDCSNPAHTHYDQRQNGTENYRLNIDGVVIAVAPAESIMSSMGDLDELLELAMEEYQSEYKPKPPSSSPAPLEIVSLPQKVQEKPEGEKPLDGKPQDGKPEESKPVEESKKQGAKLEDLEAQLAQAAHSLSDVSLDDYKVQKKEVSQKKNEKAQRLKNRLATFLLPLLRKSRHH